MSSILFALAAGLGNVVGALAVVRRLRQGLSLIETFVAFGAGFMLSVVVLEMLPEAMKGGESAAFFVLAGYLAVHLAQHVFVPHFHYGEETHEVGPGTGVSALLGLSLHTFFDGVAIASGFLVSGELGWLLFLAVLLHKLPEGVAIASITVAGGHSHQRAVGAAAALGLLTVLGVMATGVAAPLATHGLAISAGVTLYVAASDLVPEFQAKHGLRLPIAFFGGAVTFFLTRLLLHSLGIDGG